MIESLLFGQHFIDFPLFPPGWGESYPQQKESSTWGEPAAAPPVTVDNGTSAWGKPMDTSSSWDEPSRGSRESGSGWGSQHKCGRCTHQHEHTAKPKFEEYDEIKCMAYFRFALGKCSGRENSSQGTAQNLTNTVHLSLLCPTKGSSQSIYSTVTYW